jgi:hypothetical protein
MKKFENGFYSTTNFEEREKDLFKELYDKSTTDPLSFFMIDLKGKRFTDYVAEFGVVDIIKFIFK